MRKKNKSKLKIMRNNKKNLHENATQSNSSEYLFAILFILLFNLTILNQIYY